MFTYILSAQLQSHFLTIFYLFTRVNLVDFSEI